MFTRLNRPINFDSVDGKTVDLVFLLLMPPAAGSEHLAALASISRYLRDNEFAARLREAPSAAALCSLLCDRQQCDLRLFHIPLHPPSGAQSLARTCRDGCEMEL